MKSKISIIALIMAAFIRLPAQTPNHLINQVPFHHIDINDSFWAPRLHRHAHTTLPTCIAQTRDSTARINNFKVAAGLVDGTHQGIYFDDSDVYKAMEGIAYPSR